MAEQLWEWLVPVLPWFFILVMATLVAVAAYDDGGVLRQRWRRRQREREAGQR